MEQVNHVAVESSKQDTRVRSPIEKARFSSTSLVIFQPLPVDCVLASKSGGRRLDDEDEEETCGGGRRGIVACGRQRSEVPAEGELVALRETVKMCVTQKAFETDTVTQWLTKLVVLGDNSRQICASSLILKLSTNIHWFKQRTEQKAGILLCRTLS
ncbi:hypothetical protein L596_006007 [Steinernema carpocapsae]|uniref:Uncharacterized protein n=1 Tax=Steinernema carpocapsae TaxID=34508 RepID=A0A4U8V250_STECR|nr:hypothetical protein L596_006007 [Steinernema carpocapsae]